MWKSLFPPLGELYYLNKPETRFNVKDIVVDSTSCRDGITISPGDIVLDVGANVGVFSLFAAKQGARVYAFEPIPTTFEALRRNVDLHNLRDRVTPMNIGLSDQPGKRTTYCYKYLSTFRSCQPRGAEIMGFADRVADALAAMKDGDPMLYRFLQIFKFLQPVVVRHMAKKYATSSIEIECQFDTISDVIARENIQSVDLLKIDAEHAEWDILMGIKEPEWRRIQQVTMEIHGLAHREPICSLLTRHGFHITGEDKRGSYSISLQREPQ